MCVCFCVWLKDQYSTTPVFKRLEGMKSYLADRLRISLTPCCRRLFTSECVGKLGVRSERGGRGGVPDARANAFPPSPLSRIRGTPRASRHCFEE